MAITRPERLTIEGAQLLHGSYKNFSGVKTAFNREGKRYFNILIDPGLVEAMRRDGWNVKFTKPRAGFEGEHTPEPFLKVNVNYSSGRPPTIMLITSAGKQAIGEAEVSMLDYIDMANVDLLINPSPYDNELGQGVTAYLSQMFVTINETELDRKYAHVDFAPTPQRPAVEEYEEPF